MIKRIEDMVMLPEILKISGMSFPDNLKKTDFPNVKLFQLRYKVDEYEVEGLIAAPTDYIEKEYPVLIFNRGGNRDFGRLREGVIIRYASYGFICMGSKYRGNEGGTGKEDFGGEDVHDVTTLIDIAEKLSFAAAGGVFMIGHSRGGMMTWRAIKLCGDRIKAAAVKAGLSDCVDMYESRTEDMKDDFFELVGGAPQDYPAEYALRSAVCFAKQLKVPVLIEHGTEDWRVNLSQSVRMHELLDRYGTKNKLIIYQGADHSLKGYPADKDIIEWFIQYGYPKELLRKMPKEC